MKLVNILLEQQDDFNIDQKTAELKRAFGSEFAKYNPSIHLGAYSQPRPERDKYKDRGFGEVTFRYKNMDGIPEQAFNNAKEIIRQNNYEITSESNYYEVEKDERAYFPVIKFEFDLQ